MKKLQSALMILLLTLVATGQGAPAGANPRDTKEHNADVNRVLAGIVAADNAGDLERVMSFYAEDAILLPPNEASVIGKASIRSRYEAGFRNFRFDITFSSDEAQQFGDWAFLRGMIHGQAIPKGSEPSRKLNDKYIMVLHHQSDGWKIARLIWNGSDPTPKTPS